MRSFTTSYLSGRRTSIQRGLRKEERNGPAFQSIVSEAKKGNKETTVRYGNDWYNSTKQNRRNPREELDRWREANWAANNGRERKDLYTDNWDGSEYKGSPFNILSLLAFLFVATPIAGLLFAYFTYGELWG